MVMVLVMVEVRVVVSSTPVAATTAAERATIPVEKRILMLVSRLLGESVDGDDDDEGVKRDLIVEKQLNEWLGKECQLEREWVLEKREEEEARRKGREARLKRPCQEREESAAKMQGRPHQMPGLASRLLVGT